MLRILARALIVVVLGLATTFASALALAVWMPLEMYPRQDVHTFLADGRAWHAVQRQRLGVWNLWWSELDAESMTPPPPALAGNSPPVPAGGAPLSGPSVPTTPEGRLRRAREEQKANRPRDPLGYHEEPPSWGTFAAGGSARGDAPRGTDHGFGWPRPALWYRVHGVYRAPYAIATGIEGGRMLTAAPTLGTRSYDFRALPLWPHWPGLLLNTALFACLWAVALFGPGLVRRWARKRRGRCLRCGYDLRDNPAPGCPECGWNRAPA